MKKVFLLSVCIAMLSAFAIAQDQKDQKATQDVKPTVMDQKSQDQKDPKQERADWEKKLKTELKLTDDQATKFDALNKEYNDKFDALAQDASLNKDAMKEKKMNLKKEKEAKLFEFLTPEQQTTYKAIIDKKMKEAQAAPKTGY
jgi:predicted transglutaminase-like cysteine proteinase